MGSIPRVLHRAASPISTQEFADAVHAICKPRFPKARGTLSRPIGLAISGGVDSMALATLFHKLTRSDPWLKIADNPVAQPTAFIVDHKLREGSDAEALAVKKLLTSKFDWRTHILPITWPESGIPSNPETQARALRYRALGEGMRIINAVSLMMAHHEDDQYETILLRLKEKGITALGMRGMRSVQDIPECSDVHGVYQSGFVDDQRLDNPFYDLRPSPRERKYVRQNMLDQMDDNFRREWVKPGLDSNTQDTSYLFEANKPQSGTRKRAKKHTHWREQILPLEFEDGGIKLYRPLLEFPKDRLIATCEANDVPWFEDKTNADPTLTPRNAVRHMWQGYDLPVALQKPNILATCKRNDAVLKGLEAEAARLIAKMPFFKFEEHAGTLTAQMPKLNVRVRRPRARNAATWREERRKHKFLVAAFLLRLLVGAVTNKEKPAPMEGSFIDAINKMFPNLRDPSTPAANSSKIPTLAIYNITISATQEGKRAPVQWFFSRAPYYANHPHPFLHHRARKPTHPHLERLPHGTKLPEWNAMTKPPFQLWDGRFWVGLNMRADVPVMTLPFDHERSKEFRFSLPTKQRLLLEQALRDRAPGKVRSTIPALYISRQADWILRKGTWKPGNNELNRWGRWYDSVLDEKGHPKWDVPSDNTRGPFALVALPTLDVCLPGVEQWLRWEVRYRRVEGAIRERIRAGERSVVGRGYWVRRHKGEKSKAKEKRVKPKFRARVRVARRRKARKMRTGS